MPGQSGARRTRGTLTRRTEGGDRGCGLCASVMDRSGAQSAPTSSLGNSHRPQTFDVPADRVAPEKFRGNNQTWLLPTITRTDIVRVMAYLTAGVEYGLHCLLWLAGASGTALSSRDLGELQGVSS